MRGLARVARFTSTAGPAAAGAAPAAHDVVTQERIASLCKRRGFVQPGSDLYGGLKGTFDFGPRGAALRKNVRDLWMRDFVERRSDCVAVETPILMRSEVWEAAGHVTNFADPVIECKGCHHRVRADHVPAGAKCGNCGAVNWTDVMAFNLMLSTSVGATGSQQCYLRPETAQGIFCAAKFASPDSIKLPYGIAQIGKAFRNEINPANFVFRSREFEQMELEFFVEDAAQAQHWFDYWVRECHAWLLRYGVRDASLRVVHHPKADLAHYSSATADIEFRFAHGWGELWGIANRTDYDLRQHAAHSKRSLAFVTDTAGEVYPHVVEPSVGLDRLMYALLTDAFVHETLADGTAREVLRLHPLLAPCKFAVLPLLKRDDMVSAAHAVHKRVQRLLPSEVSLAGTIGKRYRRHDEVGTPYCVTVDHQTLADATVTIRDRDSMTQERVSVDEIVARARRLKLDE